MIHLCLLSGTHVLKKMSVLLDESEEMLVDGVSWIELWAWKNLDLRTFDISKNHCQMAGSGQSFSSIPLTIRVELSLRPLAAQ